MKGFATWLETLLENFRDTWLDRVFLQLLEDFLPWLLVACVAYFSKSLLKKFWKWLKEWVKKPFKEKLADLAIMTAVIAVVVFVCMAGVRWWENYVKPVQYIDTEVSFYAGEEDAYNRAELNHPDCMDAEGVDVAYVWDSSEIHELRGSWEETYGLGRVQPNKSKFIQTDDYGLGDYAVDALHVRKGELYALTTPWGDDSAYPDREHCDYRFTILRVRGGDRDIERIQDAGLIPSNVTDMMDEPFYAGTDWIEMRFTDFLISNNGDTLWLTRQDIGGGTVILQKIAHVADNDFFSIADLEWYADLQYDVTDNNKPRLAMDKNGNLYISAPEDHEILRFDFEHGADSFKIFAGDEHQEGSHRDGANPRFINPTSIAVKGDYLYVYDSGTVRRVSLINGKCVTMAGRILPGGEGETLVPNKKQTKVSGADAVLPCGQYPGMAVLDNGTVLLCNRESGVIYRIAERHDS